MASCGFDFPLVFFRQVTGKRKPLSCRFVLTKPKIALGDGHQVPPVLQESAVFSAERDEIVDEIQADLAGATMIPLGVTSQVTQSPGLAFLSAGETIEDVCGVDTGIAETRVALLHIGFVASPVVGERCLEILLLTEGIPFVLVDGADDSQGLGILCVCQVDGFLKNRHCGVELDIDVQVLILVCAQSELLGYPIGMTFEVRTLLRILKQLPGVSEGLFALQVSDQTLQIFKCQG